MRDKILEKYGFEAPDAYIVDLIKFVDEMTNGIPDESDNNRGNDIIVHPI